MSRQALDCALLAARHLRHPHVDRDRRVSGVHDSGSGVPNDGFSPHRGRHRQRRRAHQSDAGDGHAAHRRGDERGAGTGAGPVDHQPRIGRSESVLQLERRYVPDAAICERGAGARAAVAASDGEADRESADLRGVSDSGLQPDVGHDAADRVVGAGQLHHQAAAQSREWRVDGGAARRQRSRVSD